jgi:hypothetical protein
MQNINSEEIDTEMQHLNHNSKSKIVVGGGRFTVRSPIRLKSSNDLTRHSWSEVLHERISTLLQSDFYLAMNIIITLICVVLFLWAVYKNGHPTGIWFFILEALVTAVLCTEVALRVVIEKSVCIKWCRDNLDFNCYEKEFLQ